VVLHNSSDTWVNVFIDDDRVEFLDATYLLGKGTFETEEAIREKLGDDQVRSCTIGVCGEHMVRYANVTNDGRQAGRTGHGAVWASKKLKALSVRGTKGVSVADPKKLMELSFHISKEAQGKDTEKYRIYGTATNMLNMDKIGLLPTRNYQDGTFEHVNLISGEYLDAHTQGEGDCLRAVPNRLRADVHCENRSICRRDDWCGIRKPAGKQFQPGYFRHARVHSAA
jgi:aldehyde:ferredoxin oxidoreductase